MLKRSVALKFIALACFLEMFLASAAQAEEVQLSAVPTNWRLQHYAGGGVVLWFTPSPCTNGLLQFEATATQTEHDRLWSLILSAKLSQRPVFITYESTTCRITSFGMDGP